MVQYRDLNAPPPRMLADVVADMRAAERQSKTGDAGVKDLGETGDVVWPRPDGTPVSVRDVDLDLADARQRIEDAEGDLAGAQARIDTALDAEGHIREDEILRNATLLGDTVVEQINVTGKLVGTDGVFTGTVDFANVNVTGELLANEISGEHVYGTVIEGGEIRTGNDESRGSFLLGDRAYVYPHDGYQAPGIRFTPAGSTMIHPPGLGILGDQLALSGGKSESGNTSTLNVRSSGVAATVTTPTGSAEKLNSFTANNSGVYLQSRVTDGSESATVRSALSQVVGGSTIPGYATIQAAAGGVSSSIEVRQNGEAIVKSGGSVDRSLVVNTGGVWATSGTDSVSLIPEVRPFQYSAQWNADQSPAPIMVQHLPGGKLCQAQIRIQNLSGSSLSLPYDTWVQLNYNPIPSDLRGGFTDYIEVTLPQLNARGRVEMNYSTGRIRVKSLEKDKDGNPITINWHTNNSIWFPMRWFSPN